VGKMVEYYLQMEPHLFDAAIEKQLQALQDEKERKEQQARDAKSASPGDVSNMVLYRSTPPSTVLLVSAPDNQERA